MWSSVIGCLVMLILSVLAVPLTADAQPPGTSCNPLIQGSVFIKPHQV
jgi:hypothetical protein